MKKSKIRRFLSGCLAVCMLMCMLASCSSSKENPQDEEGSASSNEPGAASGSRVLPGGLVVPEGKTTSFTIQAEMDVGTLNPWGTLNSCNSLLSLNIHERLFEYNDAGTIDPFLVKNYEWISETVMQIEIWHNINDCEGNPFTTSDILFSFNQAKDSAALSSKMSTFDFDNMEIIDEYTMNIAFLQGNILVYDNLASINMVTEAAFNASGDNMEKNVVGLGTYRVTNYMMGTEIVLEKNDNYWMTDENVAEGAVRYNQNVDKIIVKIISDATQRTIEFDSGTIDCLYVCPTSSVELYQNDSNAVAYSTSTGVTRMLYFNCTSNSIMQNADLRRAVAYAINTEDINVGAFDGLLTAATQLAGPRCAEHNADIEEYPYDPDKVAEYLGKAGYGAGELTLHCIYASGHELVAQIVQNQLANVGINVTIEEVDSANITTIINTELDGWDICINQNAQNCGTILFYFYNLLNGNGTSRGGWTNEEYQGYMEEALRNGDQETTMKAYNIVVDECVSYALAYAVNWHVNKPGVENPTDLAAAPMVGNWEYTEEATWLIDD